jgi:small subunit ribosomal protein S5
MIQKKLRGRREPETDEERIAREISEKEKALEKWVPKTRLGRMVKVGKITNIDEIFSKGERILEPQIIDSLVNLEQELIEVAKTTRVVRAGRKFSYRAAIMVGDKNGHVGIGTGKDTERFPAIEKATRAAKLNLRKVYLGSGAWEEQPTDDKHSIPFKVIGKYGGVHVTLMPAPKGTGLVVGKNIRKVMEFAGVRNVWSKARGSSATKINFVNAAIKALEQTGKARLSNDIEKKIMK